MTNNITNETKKKSMFEKEVEELINSLNNFISYSETNIKDIYDIEDIKDKLTWIKDYFNIRVNPEILHKEKVPFLKRGSVVLVKLGENIGMEFSGDHPAIVLRDCKEGNDQVLILPLTTQKPEKFEPKANTIYIEIGKIQNLTGFQDESNPKNEDNGKHWANILNVKSISKKRITYPPEKSVVSGTILHKISATINAKIALGYIKKSL